MILNHTSFETRQYRDRVAENYISVWLGCILSILTPSKWQTAQQHIYLSDLMFSCSSTLLWLGTTIAAPVTPVIGSFGTSAYVNHDLFKRASQNKVRRAFVFIKHRLFFLFFSPDKTLIHRLVSFIAIWSCTETVVLTFNHLESI